MEKRGNRIKVIFSPIWLTPRAEKFPPKSNAAPRGVRKLMFVSIALNPF